jgi:hypothetical protein
MMMSTMFLLLLVGVPLAVVAVGLVIAAIVVFTKKD